MKPKSATAASPLTPRQKKASRSLFKELAAAVRTTDHSIARLEQAMAVVNGTIAELEAAARSAHVSLESNARMYASTKETGPKGPKGPTYGPRTLNGTEMQELKDRLRDELWVSGDERFPTEYEIGEEVKKVLEKEKMLTQSKGRMNGVANKPIVTELEKLRDSASRMAAELVPFKEKVIKQMGECQEIKAILESHRDMRDSLFDPVLSNPVIKTSVLYQKMNPMAPLTLPLDDKNMGSEIGRLPSPYNPSAKMTGHEATEVAAEREDGARDAINKALRAVRDARTELNSRKSALQISVRAAREIVVKQRRAINTGNFGSSEERNTDPATRKMALNPEDEH